MNFHRKIKVNENKWIQLIRTSRITGAPPNFLGSSNASASVAVHRISLKSAPTEGNRTNRMSAGRSEFFRFPFSFNPIRATDKVEPTSEIGPGLSPRPTPELPRHGQSDHFLNRLHHRDPRLSHGGRR